MRRTLLLIVLVGAVLGACGNGDDDSGSTTPSSARLPTTTLASPVTSTPSGSVPATTTTTTAGPAGAALGESSTLDLRGLGPVRVGMTLAEATAAAGVPVVGPAVPPECSYAKPEGGPAGVAFMIVEGRIARVDVMAGSAVKTVSGAGIGDTEAEVQARYGGSLQVSPHKYLPSGHYLTYVPTDPVDADFRGIFETDGSRVTSIRAGKLPEVAYVEGCS